MKTPPSRTRSSKGGTVAIEAASPQLEKQEGPRKQAPPHRAASRQARAPPPPDERRRHRMLERQARDLLRFVDPVSGETMAVRSDITKLALSMFTQGIKGRNIRVRIVG